MAVSGAVGVFQVGTGIIGTEYSVTGLADQPQLVLFFWNGRNSASDAVGSLTHLRGFGASAGDGSTNRAVTGRSQHAAGTAVADCYQDSNNCIVVLDSTGSPNGGQARCVSFTSDGFDVEIVTVFDAAMRVVYVALWGLDDVAVGTIQEPAVTGDQDITFPGFEPTAVIISHIVSSAGPPGGVVDSLFGLGFAAGATPQNVVYMGGANDGPTTMQTESYCRAGECIAMAGTGVAALGAHASVTAWLSNGFRLNWTERAGARDLFCVAWRGGSAIVGDFVTSTSGGATIAESGFGFTPTVGLLLSAMVAADASDTPHDHDMWTMGAFTGPSSRFALGVRDQDNVGTSVVDTAIEYDAAYVSIVTGGTIQGLVDIQSMDSDGVTFIQDDADPSAAFVGYLILGNATPIAPKILLTQWAPTRAATW